MAQNFGLSEPLPIPFAPAPQPLVGAAYIPSTNRFTLASAGAKRIPQGRWLVSSTAAHTALQWLDPVQQQWTVLAGNVSGGFGVIIQSDGYNFRVANLTGMGTGASVGAAGTGYVQATTTVTVSAGNSTWYPVVGGALGTPTIVAGGANYSMPPLVFFDVPAAPGVQATGLAVLSAGAVASITIENAGAGYLVAPNVYIIPDPSDPNGQAGIITNATATVALTGAGTITAVLLQNFGTSQSSAPTLTINGAGSSGTATALPGSWVTPAADTSVVMQPAP